VNVWGLGVAEVGALLVGHGTYYTLANPEMSIESVFADRDPVEAAYMAAAVNVVAYGLVPAVAAAVAVAVGGMPLGWLGVAGVTVGDLALGAGAGAGLSAVAQASIVAAEALAEVFAQMPWDAHAHPKETFDYVDHKEQEWDDGEVAAWVVRPRAGEDGAGEIAGQTGLRPEWDRRVAGFSVWLRPRFWGRDYSVERAAALLHVAFAVLDLDLVAVNHVVDNERSRRAIEKYVDRFGGRREGTLRNFVPFEDGPRDAVRYSISREEYEASRPHDVEVSVRA
jgi:ribosomal-protein-alanine N-acetyltransferase